ncbi:hypothetical protein PG988_009170 [Apiospora saccharicola]
MRSSAFFLSILLLSEASAAGPLRRRERRGSCCIVFVIIASVVDTEPVLYPGFHRCCFYIYIVDEQQFSYRVYTQHSFSFTLRHIIDDRIQCGIADDVFIQFCLAPFQSHRHHKSWRVQWWSCNLEHCGRLFDEQPSLIIGCRHRSFIITKCNCFPVSATYFFGHCFYLECCDWSIQYRTNPAQKYCYFFQCRICGCFGISIGVSRTYCQLLD